MDQRAIMTPRVERQVRRTAGDLRIGRGRMGWLVGVEREVAVAGYVVALKTLFLTSAVVAAVATLVQAGTGWRAVDEVEHGGKSGAPRASDEEERI